MTLSGNTVNVYFADVTLLENEEFYRAAFLRASKERREKTERLGQIADKRRSLAAELLLRKALEDAGLRLPELRYGYGAHGKPFLPDAPGFCFSISHSGDKVMAVSADSEVGCDIEMIVQGRERIAGRFFSGEEKEYLSGLPEEERNGAFYRLWTAKESFLKATGEGFALPLNAFSVRCENGGRIGIVQGTEPGEYSVSEVTPGREYKAAVCRKGGPFLLNAEVADLKELLS